MSNITLEKDKLIQQTLQERTIIIEKANDIQIIKTLNLIFLASSSIFTVTKKPST